MKATLFSLIIIILLVPPAFADVSWTVLDDETGKPIEDAVVRVEWDVDKGFMLRDLHTFKIFEAKTDKDGKVTVPDVKAPRVSLDTVVVYKAGYVGWSNRIIFPGYKKRKDFEWKEVYMIRMERFKKEYKYSDHRYFLSSAIGIMSANELMSQAVEWEMIKGKEEIQEMKRIEKDRKEKGQ